MSAGGLRRGCWEVIFHSMLLVYPSVKRSDFEEKISFPLSHVVFYIKCDADDFYAEMIFTKQNETILSFVFSFERKAGEITISFV